MQIKSFLKIISAALVIMIAISSCSKGSDPKPGSSFDKSKFRIDNVVFNDVGDEVFINFDETNTSTLNYDYTIHGRYKIKMTLKTTDGTTFQEDMPLPATLDAGVTSSQILLMLYTSGKTLDLSSFKYEILTY